MFVWENVIVAMIELIDHDGIKIKALVDSVFYEGKKTLHS